MNHIPASPRRTVLSFGMFDLSQPSQAIHLRALCALGDDLILGCATDDFAQLHGLESKTGYRDRRAMLEHCRYVDRVIAQQTMGQIRTDIVNYNVCVFAMGDEWTGHFDALEDIAQVIYLPRPAGGAPVPPRVDLTPQRLHDVAV